MTRLKIVSWNIWGGKNLSEIIEVLKEIDADIIGLQEVLESETGTNNNAKAIADALGYEYVYTPTTLLTPSVSHLLKEIKVEENMQWGNAILSKHAIKNSVVHILSETKKRTALEAIITIEDRGFHFFSTHLAYVDKFSSEIQLTQTENLLKTIPAEFAIVVGDFNAIPQTKVIEKMKEVLTDAWSKGTEAPHTHTSTETGIESTIDYIFTTKDIRVLSAGVIKSRASDHFPVYGIIER